MQYKDAKTTLLAKTIGSVIRNFRTNKVGSSINKFAREFDLDIGNTSRIENGSTDVKFVTLWKISEGLGLKPSALVKIIEDKLGTDFHFYEE
ncbi:helix-turn-helix transcriptional regulator [bacterium]|nr:helix-turn-helix transcriptional regulator [bacterium]